MANKISEASIFDVKVLDDEFQLNLGTIALEVRRFSLKGITQFTNFSAITNRRTRLFLFPCFLNKLTTSSESDLGSSLVLGYGHTSVIAILHIKLSFINYKIIVGQE